MHVLQLCLESLILLVHLEELVRLQLLLQLVLLCLKPVDLLDDLLKVFLMAAIFVVISMYLGESHALFVFLGSG